MTVQKRGLGRGLEALLTDVSTQNESAINATAVLVQAIQQEKAHLIQEAETLQALLAEFERLVRNLNLD
jgi:hypothetical protein